MAMPATAAQAAPDEGDARPPLSLAQQEATRNALDRVVGRLTRLADDQCAKKRQIEERWYRNLRNYYGRYDPTTEANLVTEKRSRVFVQATKKKTNAWEAKLYDMLFPTDDENWDIQPTPDPDLSQQHMQAKTKVVQMTDMATQLHAKAVKTADQAGQERARQIALQAQQGPGAEVINFKSKMDEAKQRALKMRRAISDQLQEAHYNIKCRDLIHDMCRLGTGILKGPLTSGRMRKSWMQDPAGKWAMKLLTDPRPEVRRVDPWHYFPDMTATSREDCEFDFERYLQTRSGLQKLAQQPGYDRQAIKDLLEQGARDALPEFIAILRTITKVDQALDSRWIVWEYCGPLEDDEITAILTAQMAHPDPSFAAQAADDLALVKADPLANQQFIVTFCQNKLLKFGIHPLDSGESLYSVLPFEIDESTMFGLGIPELMEGSQSAVNGAWRMILDNAALSVGPQVVIDKKAIVPENGSWRLTPRKVWLMNTSQLAGQPALFQLHNIQSNLADLMGIVTAALRFVDDESAMPTIAEGEQGTHETKTAGGMSLLMNSANVVFRRVVRNFDDCITTPTIGRYYDWNMQHNNDNDIKGDMDIVAKGSAILLVREIQGPNMMAITTQWSVHPILGKLLKVAPAARKTVTGLMIHEDEIIKTDEELAEDAQREAQQPPQKSPDQLKIEGQLALQDKKHQGDLELEDMRRNTEMQVIAAQSNITLEELRAKVGVENAKIGSNERKFNAEAALAAKLPAASAQTVAGGAQAA